MNNKINTGTESTENNRKPASGRNNADLPDSPKDQEKLKSEETTLDLPDVSDIPGQEHIHVPPLGALGDTTISSGDEEGDGLFEDDVDDETTIVMGTEADIPA